MTDALPARGVRRVQRLSFKLGLRLRLGWINTLYVDTRRPARVQ